MTKGFFNLQTPQDLLQKLRHDFGRLKESPLDSYAAFDFLVTAYHMLEWRYPGKSNNAKRRQMERDGKSKLLWVCSHLANGSKHFQATRRDAVKDTIGVSIPRVGNSRTNHEGIKCRWESLPPRTSSVQNLHNCPGRSAGFEYPCGCLLSFPI